MSTNPADSNPLNQAAAAQTTLLEQHDNTLKALMDHMRTFSADLSNLRSQIAALIPPLTPDPPEPTPAQPSPAQPSTIREAFVPPPAPYSGDLGSCKSFLTQCSLIFEQQPMTYSNDCTKIAYLIGCLRGHALSWTSAVWEKQSQSCSSYSAFTTEMRDIFDLHLLLLLLLISLFQNLNLCSLAGPI